jgi:hypothetical protein
LISRYICFKLILVMNASKEAGKGEYNEPGCP